MNISLFDFDLPEHLIAQMPADIRDQSRLMVIDRKNGSISHHRFSEIIDFFPENAVIMRNNASVLPARLRGFLPGGGGVECLLLNPGRESAEWWCLVRPGRKLHPGTRFGLTREWSAEILSLSEDGRRLIRFTPERNEDFLSLVNRLGEMPLPPYIRREAGDERNEIDRERYQTIFAEPEKQVATAAPTAGLHFTSNLQEQILAQNFTFSDLTLHIGLGTFKPIRTERIQDHPIHREIYEMPPGIQKLLLHKQPPPRIAVGTTVTRAVEDFLNKNHSHNPSENTFIGEADLFVYPPFQFKGTDALITNFHLPRSTLLCMVSAFLTPGKTDGIKWLKELYREAIREKYRFFSYGDAMLIL